MTEQEDGLLASQRKRYRRTAPTFPSDFPKRLERFEEASGLSWGEMVKPTASEKIDIWYYDRHGI